MKKAAGIFVVVCVLFWIYIKIQPQMGTDLTEFQAGYSAYLLADIP